MASVFPVHVLACGVVFVRACGALAMPAGTRPGRVLELIVVTMVGNQYMLYISNSSTAARLHHRVRKLTGILGSFDIIHHTMGAVFGFNKDFGTLEYAILQRKQLRNLGVRDGSVITTVTIPPDLDSDGDEIPALVSSESEAEQPPRRRRRRRRRPLRQCSRVHTEGRPSRLTAKDFIFRFQARTSCERSRLRRSCHATHAQWV